jgi:hypothetical protein
MVKKTISSLFILVSLLPVTLSAQNMSKWSFGVEFGLNYSNSSEDTSPLQKECPILPRIGVSLEYNLFESWYVQSGIEYSMKGLKSSGETEFLKASVELDQQVIQMPILLNYKFALNKFKIVPGAGIYYSYGVGGKTKAIGQVNGNEIDITKTTFGNILKHQDMGLIFKLSSQLDHFLLNLSYEYGLKNIGIANVLGAPLDYKNRVASISVGYLF